MNKTIKINYENTELHLLFLLKTGSKLYGTNLTKGEHPLLPDYESDNDYKGVFIYDIKNKINFFKKLFDTLPLKDKNNDITTKNKNDFKKLFPKNFINFEDDDDITLFELEKFINLSLNNNPDMIDILFAPREKFLYISELGEKILDLKEFFISQQIKKTFTNFAISQLERIKNHNKWVVRYPKIKIVIDIIKKAYVNKDINSFWISNIFSPLLTKYIKDDLLENNIIIDEKETLKNVLDFNEFIEKYVINNNEITLNEFKTYAKPTIINYCYIKGLIGESFDIQKDKISDLTILNIHNKDMIIKEYLEQCATFRNISATLYTIFDENLKNQKDERKNNSGLFALDGDIKVSPQTYVGENFLCHLSVDRTKYLREYKNIENLWSWKTNRNEKRGILEDIYGYDTKHAAHTFRLLKQSLKILTDYKEYKTVLDNDDIKEFKDILFGKYSYDDIILIADELKEEVNNTISDLPITISIDNYNQIIELTTEYLYKYFKLN